MSDKTTRPQQLSATATFIADSSSRPVLRAEDPLLLHDAWPVEPASPFAGLAPSAAHISLNIDRFGSPRGGAEGKDPIMRSLCSALEAAEQGDDRPCADALRLAMAIRLGGLVELRASVNVDNLRPKIRPVRALQKWRLKRVLDYIDNHLAAKITLLDLAAIAGLSRMHFASQFRKATDVQPHEYLLTRRVRRAEQLLQDGTMPIVEIALTVGFQTQAHFTTVFKRFVGCTPCRWRAINREIRTHDCNRFEKASVLTD